MTAIFARYGLAAAAIVFVSTTLPACAEASDRIRYRCKAVGTADISLAAKYEIRNKRKRFSAEFEAAPNLGFAAGQRLNVSVDGAVVGSIMLEKVLGGDAVGDLNLASRAEPPEWLAFPTNWPAGVGKDSDVKVLKGATAVLGCSLR